MEEKQDKKEEETPKLVEVYGDDVVKEEKKQKKEDSKKEKDTEKKESSKEEMDSDDNQKKSDTKKTPEEIVEEIIEERQAFKTEVVDETTDEKIEVVKDGEEVGEESKRDEIKTQEVKTQDETAFEDEIGSQRSAVRGVFGVGVFVFLIIFGLTGWAFYLKSVWLPNESLSEVVVEASPTPESTLLSEPTPAPLTREEITLDVLNGSGVTGLAGKTATVFEELGYVIGKTGNAESTNENELYIKEDLLNKLGVLYEDVLEKLEISSPSGYLEVDDKIDAQIVLGK